jgi:hypothetical protein
MMLIKDSPAMIIKRLIFSALLCKPIKEFHYSIRIPCKECWSYRSSAMQSME